MVSFNCTQALLKKWLSRFGWLVCVLLISACSTLDIGKAPAFAPKSTWVLLPVMNHTETPQAGLRAESIIDSVMRTDGNVSLLHYPANLNTESLFEPAERKTIENALQWAKSIHAAYAVTGSVDEWRYKVGVDGEPAVGITLRVWDVPTGQVVWSGTGGKTGWSREALSAVAQKLIRSLLAPVAQSAQASTRQ